MAIITIRPDEKFQKELNKIKEILNRKTWDKPVKTSTGIITKIIFEYRSLKKEVEEIKGKYSDLEHQNHCLKCDIKNYVRAHKSLQETFDEIEKEGY